MAKAYTPGNSHIIPYDQCSDRKDATDFQIPEMKEHNVIGKKLLDARKNAKMSRIDTIASLEKYGTTVTISTISRWERGIVSPSVPQFLALCDIYHIDDIAEYFIGTPIEAVEDSPELDKKGLDILQTVKEALIASGQFVPASRDNTTSFAEATKMRSMPVSENLASAGTGSWLNDDQFTLINVPVNQIPAGADFGIRISGDSMEPIYTDHQIVWVQKCKELRPGEVGIFICDEDGYIKQYREEMPDEDEYDDYLCDGVLRPKISLISFNEKYPPKAISPYCRFEIVGRVLN